ncbi:hypothetical protein D9758_007143 [Tetrapyrgos nigripes]|uniref:DUF6535 domain-containing protein n=1 Tax=Tetrapyrgos nigripes TaxID=182062 RepID=A0A8H5GDW0_9AGAR|nr:hypothetical protein D9758_007143 [Tetrapyrgos nigripes]
MDSAISAALGVCHLFLRTMFSSLFRRVIQIITFQTDRDVQDAQDIEAAKFAPRITVDKTRPKEPYKPTVDDEACSKLWSIYIDEARRYDEELLIGWKKDMDGMLLFSALYSASLTAFLIESYKTLQDDPTQNTVFFLVQISRQLAANGATDIPFQSELPAFEPPLSAIICNVLWFLSLALALTCSLLATFVQQWTRDFIHKTTLKPSPVRQARVIAYMYSGLREFGMHSFVDMIPILLHISLFFFFGGLVGFLVPVNGLLTYIMSCVLVIILAVYLALTCIPLLHLNAPYRTPLSGTLWHYGNAFSDLLMQKHTLLRRDETLTEAMHDKSLDDTAHRDQQAVTYTMKSLTDDNELLPLLEAIPDAIFDATNPKDPIRKANLHLIMPLLETSDPQVNVLARIAQFTQRSSGWTDSSLADRSSSACLQALWPLMHMLIRKSPNSHLLERLSIKNDYIQTDHLFIRDIFLHFTRNYDPANDSIPSVLAIMRLCMFYSVRNAVDAVKELLAVSSPVPASELRRRFSFITEKWESILSYPVVVYGFPCQVSTHLRTLLDKLDEGPRARDPYMELEQALDIIGTLSTDTVWQDMRLHVFCRYLIEAGNMLSNTGRLPHWFNLIIAHDYAAPLIRLKQLLDEGSTGFSQTTDEYMVQCMKLFLSIKTALSNSRESVAGRRFVLSYFCNRADGEDLSLWDTFSERDLLHVGECVLEELRLMDEGRLPLKTALLILSLPSQVAEQRYPALSLRLWNVIRSPHVSSGLRQELNYALLKAVIDGIVLSRIPVLLDRHPLLPVHFETERLKNTLMQEYLPHRIFVQSLWRENSYPGSLWIALLAQWTDLITQEPDNHKLPCNWDKFAKPFLEKSELKVDVITQLHFAESVSRLCDAIITANAGPEHHLVRIYFRICAALWRYCPSGTEWCWITSPRCATYLLKATRRLDESIGSRRLQNGVISGRQGHNALAERCRTVLGGRREQSQKRVMDKKKRFSLPSTRTQWRRRHS